MTSEASPLDGRFQRPDPRHAEPGLHGDFAGFKYGDVLYCPDCLPTDVFAQAREANPHPEGQFFPWEDVKGTGWTCDRCGNELWTPKKARKG